MKKLLFILLALPILAVSQTKKPRQATKRAPKETRYYYDSLGAKRNWDSMMTIVIKQVIDTMKVRGYIKNK